MRSNLRLACFDSSEQWEAWQRYNRLSNGPVSPCHDCTPQFKHSMMTAGRCEQPAIVFVVRDGAMMGLLPHEVFGTDMEVSGA